MMKKQRQRETRKMNQASMKTDKLSIQRVKRVEETEKIESIYVAVGLQCGLTIVIWKSCIFIKKIDLWPIVACDNGTSQSEENVVRWFFYVSTAQRTKMSHKVCLDVRPTNDWWLSLSVKLNESCLYDSNVFLF